MSVVRENLMNKYGYTPYCGAPKCNGGIWPRTFWNGHQFACKACGWATQFDVGFIEDYKNKWNTQETSK